MKTEEIIVDGEKKTIVVELPDDFKEDYVNVDLENTIELDEIVSEITGENDE